jgi:DNA-binding response OmpR family regulator
MTKTWRRLLKKMRDAAWKHSSVQGEAPGDVMELGDFRIDLFKETVTVRGRELQLTAAEFETLVFLTDHPKSFVTPHTAVEISCAGHGLQQAEFLRVLLSLRKKLESQDATNNYIRAEPWIFYRFDPRAS